MFGQIALFPVVSMPNQKQVQILLLIAEKQDVDSDFADAVDSKEYKALLPGIDQSIDGERTWRGIPLDEVR